jgi:hypothetical protein
LHLQSLRRLARPLYLDCAHELPRMHQRQRIVIAKVFGQLGFAAVTGLVASSSRRYKKEGSHYGREVRNAAHHRHTKNAADRLIVGQGVTRNPMIGTAF